ncbi:MAG: folate-binding protein YgfZ [Gammaproteobacteria bacterium]|nr:folate-binding protein YgfZ [Gammaproteobacteria bacterium]
MNSEWRTFLQTHSASISETDGAQFPQSGTDPACALIDLSHFGLISVSGEDAETFLQGQVTNDVRNLTGENFQISACCSPKGRMLANFLCFRRQQEILLQLPRDTQQLLLKRLPMFILMSRVKVTDASDKLVCFGVLGECAEVLLRDRFSRIPERVWERVEEDGFTLLRPPGATQRFQLIGEPDGMMALWKQLAETAKPVSSDRWMLENIRAGVPTIHGSNSEAFIPQMANMQLIEGVSFTKGCYTGQEVVARTRYLGKVKRRMYLARIDSARCPLPGEVLYSPESQSGQGAGRVVDAQHDPDGGCELLAVIEIACHDAGDVRIGSEAGEPLIFQTLPYSFEDN